MILFTGGGGGCMVPGGVPGPPPETATAAGGTHPTGMHSSLVCLNPVKFCLRF